ncbi:MAG: TRAP transporter small permease subunit [Pseudomonadota bacterium]
MADFVSIMGTVLRYAGYAALPVLLLPLLVLVIPGLVGRFAGGLSKVLDRVSGYALAVAMTAAFVIIVIQLAAVLLRYVFGLSFSWLNDSVIFSFATIFMLGAAATLRDDGHVRVDIMRPRFSPRGRAVIEIVGSMVFIVPIGILILYSGASFIARTWEGLEPFNESDGLPVKYLFKTLIPVFAVLMIGQAVSQATKAALSLRGLRPFEGAEHEHGGAV